MNTCTCEKEMEILSKAKSYLIPINDFILEAYKAGVKDINVEVQQDHPVTGPAPVIFVNCYKSLKEQEETNNTLDILEALNRKKTKFEGFNIHVHTSYLASHFSEIDLLQINNLLEKIQQESLIAGGKEVAGKILGMIQAGNNLDSVKLILENSLGWDKI